MAATATLLALLPACAGNAGLKHEAIAGKTHRINQPRPHGKFPLAKQPAFAKLTVRSNSGVAQR